MNPMPILRRKVLPTLLATAGFAASALAQEVSIPDPGLNVAVREALQKPSGPLTTQDMLDLTNLNAQSRSISTVEGIESARNLVHLDLNSNSLNSNSLANFAVPGTLTNLQSLKHRTGSTARAPLIRSIP